MMFKWMGLVLVVAFVSVQGVAAECSSTEAIAHINRTLTNDMKQRYSDAYRTSGATAIPRIKQSIVKVLKNESVVATASNGQMTVRKTELANYATSIRNTGTGRAIKACIDEKNDAMYEEAGRTSQCIFKELKKTCVAENRRRA